VDDKRAIGVIRVSEVKGREGESFRSPENQRERIAKLCESSDWRLSDVYEEMDVGGAAALEDRPGLLKAVEAVEARGAAVVVVGYFDRLVRDPHVRDQFVDRVEAAGGEVWTADMGRTSNGTAAERFVGGVLAQAARFVRDSAAEKARAAQVEAVAAGIWMSPGVPAGYALGADRRLTPDPKLAPVVRAAFEIRARGARLEEVRSFLAEHGIERTRAGVAQLLRNRAVLGELHFGNGDGGLHNVDAHPAIVDWATFERVQRVTVTRGRQPKSNELLARLGVLRCASCGARMSVTTSNYRYRAYRCGNPDCAEPATIAAPLVEGIVVGAVKEAVADVEGRASAEENINAAAAALDAAQTKYDAAVKILDPTEPADIQRRDVLRRERDAAREHLDQLGGLAATRTITAAANWDELTFDARRELIRATVERVTVTRGRGPERVAVELVGE
jgi:DNA invertase Pin-like site-specific DNA recombinase